MPSRQVKAYFNNPKLQNHREHRSRRGRKSKTGHTSMAKDFKKRKQKLSEQELINEAKQYD